MKWIKLSEGKPKRPDKYFVKYSDGTKGVANWFLNEFNPSVIEWLDESPSLSSEQGATGFAEWIVKEGYIFSHYDPHDKCVYYHISEKNKRFDITKHYYVFELYNLYKQSKK